MKVIYVVLAPLSFYYGKFLNIENFQKSQFKVEICDLSLMFYSEKDIKSYFYNTKTQARQEDFPRGEGGKVPLKLLPPPLSNDYLTNNNEEKPRT